MQMQIQILFQMANKLANTAVNGQAASNVTRLSVARLGVTSLVLASMLGACAPAPTSLTNTGEAETETGEVREADTDSAGKQASKNSAGAEGDRTNRSSEEDGVDEAIACNKNPEPPKPLSAPENTPVFEQFNFQPENIAAEGNTVVVETPHYTFARCQGKDWTITATEAEAEEPYDYRQELTNIQDPAYETIEVGGSTYAYRIRLQAEWLAEQLAPETQPAETAEQAPEAAEPIEDAVIFELKAPDGELISEQLYTLSALQDASLGASLGVPSIAGAVVTNDSTANEVATVWFAATASQGEGDSGFASLIQYNTQDGDLTVSKPNALQGDQITSIATTGSLQASEDSENSKPLTLWLGTKRSGEGNPYFPASGLVAYQPSSEALTNYTITNSAMSGAIPYQLVVADESLWVGTGNGVCEVQWQTADEANSWDCWRFSATAELPSEGLELYPSFLAAEPLGKLKDKTVEVLWATQTHPEEGLEEADNPAKVRYEVVYDKGIEAELSQGGYRLANEVARRAVGGEPIFWPGRQWHWRGDRFVRGLDEVSLNLVGGGPYGLVSSSARKGFDFDHRAIRGEFDLLSLTADSTKVKYYSGWMEGAELEVYPAIVPVELPKKMKPNPLTDIAKTLTEPQGP